MTWLSSTRQFRILKRFSVEHTSVENSASLLVNGGFEEETPIGEDPIGWRLRNVGVHPSLLAAEETDACHTDKNQLTTQVTLQNFWKREVSPQKYPGYRSYLMVNMGSPDAIELEANLLNLQAFNPWLTSAQQVPYPDDRTPFAAYADDCRYTMGFSIEVLGGVGKISTYAMWDNNGTEVGVNDDGDDISSVAPDLIVTNIKAANWRRFAFSGRFGRRVAPAFHAKARLRGAVLRVEKLTGDPLVFKISAVNLVQGSYREVPYIGDLSYLLDPRGVVRPSWGQTLPPGFREADLSQDLFLKATDQIADVLKTGGDQFHNHELGAAELNLQTTKSRNQGSPRPSMQVSEHVHDVGPGVSTPPNRTVGLGIKL